MNQTTNSKLENPMSPTAALPAAIVELWLTRSGELKMRSCVDRPKEWEGWNPGDQINTNDWGPASFIGLVALPLYIQEGHFF